MDLSANPVQGIAHQPHALLRVKAFDGFHQADIAFLNQVALWQPITHVLA